MQVTAAEYTRLYLSALQDTLDRFPPPQPSQAAVNLLVTVGQQQEFLLWHSLLPPPGHPGSLDALEVCHHLPAPALLGNEPKAYQHNGLPKAVACMQGAAVPSELTALVQTTNWNTVHAADW